ncbi:MAG: DUF6198 family protein [Synergistaceae bacterium]|nr:DUF6198 family protein [Synergistaceae bacterium]
MNENNSKIILKKGVCYFAGLLLIAFGINISKTGGLGISPVSATPFAIETIWGVELGRATMGVYVVLVLIQIALLRKKFKPLQFLQLAITFAFGLFITFTSRKYCLLSWLPDPANYAVALSYTLISSVIIGVGVSFYLLPKWIPLPAEGLAVALTQMSGRKMAIHDAKNFVDISLVLFAAALSLVMQGKLVAVREGTVIVAILVGRVVGIGNKLYKEKLLNWVYGEERPNQ